jgi:hypothetical protein
MFSNIAEIVTGVRSLVNESTESFWTDTEIEDWIKEGLEDIAHETHCLRTWKTYTILADDIFDERELRFPSDFISIDQGKIYYNDVVCYPTSQAKLSNYDNKWRSRSGTPSEYYIRGDMYGFNRKISAGDTVKFYMIERAEEISGSVAPFNGDYRLINFRKLAIWYTVSQCWEKKNESTKADKWFARYQYGVEKMKELLGIDLDGVSAIMPEESLSHFVIEGKWPPQ